MCNDNMSSMQIIKNPTSHHRAKHIDVRFHFIRDHYENGNISLQYIESGQLCADSPKELTKSSMPNAWNS